jgi:predicted GIY-YIG superfamily endonuclease
MPSHHSVYVARGMYQGRRRVLYVGSTSRGMTRLHEHACTQGWWPLMSSTSWFHRQTRSAALETERRLIDQLAPVFNMKSLP